MKLKYSHAYESTWTINFFLPREYPLGYIFLVGGENIKGFYVLMIMLSSDFLHIMISNSILAKKKGSATLMVSE